MSEEHKQYSLQDLLYLMARLRDPNGGCPWDIKQTFSSITPSTIEEAYELVDAIEQGDANQIREELGDVLFQTIFYSQLGKEQSLFDFEDVIHSLTAKLVRRHPHVFPNGDLRARFDAGIDEREVKLQWEEIKKQERKEKSQGGLLDDIPQALPALKRAQKMQKRASQIGFDWPNASAALQKVKEEIVELEQALANNDADNIREELGDLMFSCVNVSRLLNVDAEQAVAACNHKFEQRFSFIESSLIESGGDVESASLAQMDSLWEQAKTIKNAL